MLVTRERKFDCFKDNDSSVTTKNYDNSTAMPVCVLLYTNLPDPSILHLNYKYRDEVDGVVGLPRPHLLVVVFFGFCLAFLCL